MDGARDSHPEEMHGPVKHAGATAANPIASPNVPKQQGSIKIFDRNVDRGPFDPSFISVPETVMPDVIQLRLSQLDEFLRMDEYSAQWINIRTAITLYQNPGSANGRVTYIQGGAVVPIDGVQEGSPYWIEVGIILNQYHLLSPN